MIGAGIRECDREAAREDHLGKAPCCEPVDQKFRIVADKAFVIDMLFKCH